MYSVNRHTILGVIDRTPVLQEFDGNKKLLTFHMAMDES